MDYKEKYEAVLERAKGDYAAYRKVGDIAGINAIVSIFPELVESEDERIRIRAIELIAGYIYPNSLYLEDANECIAWLENLKERKPAERGEEDEK